MDRREIEHKLGEMHFKNLPNQSWHKQQLKAALVQYGQKRRPTVSAWVKDSIKNMKINFRASSFIVGALVGVLVVSGAKVANNSSTLAKYNPFASNIAEAQAVVKDVLTKASRLSEEDRKKIDERIKDDMKKSLDEAMQAKDLQILEGDGSNDLEPNDTAMFRVVNIDGEKAGSIGITRDIKVEAHKGFTTTSSAGAEAGATFSAGTMVSMGNAEPIKIVKRLSYTDPEGRKITLALGEDGLPVFKSMSFTEADMEKMKEKMKTIELPGQAMPFEPTNVEAVEIK